MVCVEEGEPDSALVLEGDGVLVCDGEGEPNNALVLEGEAVCDGEGYDVLTPRLYVGVGECDMDGFAVILLLLTHCLLDVAVTRFIGLAEIDTFVVLYGIVTGVLQ